MSRKSDNREFKDYGTVSEILGTEHSLGSGLAERCSRLEREKELLHVEIERLKSEQPTSFCLRDDANLPCLRPCQPEYILLKVDAEKWREHVAGLSEGGTYISAEEYQRLKECERDAELWRNYDASLDNTEADDA